jgi:hypothetical protein
MTEDEYWGALKAQGIVPGPRLTDRNFSATNRDNVPLTVADPSKLTPADRVEAAERTIAIWG